MIRLDTRRRNAIIRLQQDLESLSPAQFELVCHDLLCTVERVPLLHRGLNEREHPIGYTVDSLDARSLVVGEYGTEQGYFKGSLSKVSSDIKHAKTIAPDHKRLYLMSNQECQPSQLRSVAALLLTEYPDQENGSAPLLFDVRELAKLLYEQATTKTELFNRFSIFIPYLEVMREDWAFDHSCPPCPPDYVPRKEIERQLDSLLSEHSVVALSGLSGSGKTYCAAAYANASAEKWEQIIWADGTEVNSGELSGVTISQLGVTANLETRLRSSRTLLVIDRWFGPAMELERIQKKVSDNTDTGSRIIITSVCALEGTKIPTISTHEISTEEAVDILAFELPNGPPQALVDKLMRVSGGLPVVLGVLREAVRAGDATWDDCSDALDDIGELDAEGQLLIERVLARAGSVISKELKALAFLGSREVEPTLLKRLSTPMASSKMRQRCLARSGVAGSLVVHEIILAVAANFLHESERETIAARFQDYFIEHVRKRPAHYVRSAHRHAEILRALVESQPEPGCLAKAFLDLEDARESPIVDLLVSSDLKQFSEWCSIASIVEALEVQWRTAAQGEKQAVALEYAKRLEIKLATERTDEVAEYLRHHVAKFYYFANKPETALPFLKRCDGESLPTRLQKARCLRDLGRIDEARTELVDAHSALSLNLHACSPSVALSLYAELRYREFGDLLRTVLLEHPTPFFELVETAIAEGNGQPYDTVAILANNIAYDHPSFLALLVAQVEFPPPSGRHSRQNRSVGKMFLTRAKNAFYDSDEAVAARFAEQAQHYFDKEIAGRPCGSLETRARCRELRGEHEAALQLLAGISEPDAFAQQAAARSLLLLGHYERARAEISAAIENARNNRKIQRYLPAFLSLLGDVHLAGGSASDARAAWSEALELTDGERFTTTLKAKLDDVKADR